MTGEAWQKVKEFGLKKKEKKEKKKEKNLG